MELLQEWDRQALYAVNHGLHHPWLSPLMWLFTSLGLGWVQLLLLLGATLALRWPRRWRLVFLPGVVAWLGSGATVQLLKHLVPRPRPSNLPNVLVAPDERIFARSFPSGHTATAFALACWLWLMVRGTRYRWLGWLGWLLAALVGLSRVYRGVHYPSDVLVGAAIGILWGAIAFIWLNRSPTHV
ncbi:MAG: phosphatase PAP2 family protein [Fimbriimonadales bacterium]|nr:phosphatase PAP2 family protein [Fimbriimonadales bacterium]